MKNIREWLDENLNDDANIDDTRIEKLAEIVRAEAEAAGYSNDELIKAGGGDIGEYIRNRQRERGGGNGDGKIAGEVSPILTPGFNQQ